jgi:hypothetical protein
MAALPLHPQSIVNCLAPTPPPLPPMQCIHPPLSSWWGGGGWGGGIHVATFATGTHQYKKGGLLIDFCDGQIIRKKYFSTNQLAIRVEFPVE